jgi:RepB DNA-primase from phage plasmid
MQTQSVPPIVQPLPTPHAPSNDGDVEGHPAIAHLSLLFEPKDSICITFIHAIKKSSNGEAIIENHCLPIEMAASERAIARMQARNDEGYNVYVAMNPVQSGADHRRKELAGQPRNAFMEVDEHGAEVFGAVKQSVASGEIPQPTVILQSSPGKYQFIWKINPADFTLEKVEALNQGLVLKFGADPASTDYLRLLRMPGFKNLKPLL